MKVHELLVEEDEEVDEDEVPLFAVVVNKLLKKGENVELDCTLAKAVATRAHDTMRDTMVGQRVTGKVRSIGLGLSDGDGGQVLTVALSYTRDRDGDTRFTRGLMLKAAEVDNYLDVTKTLDGWLIVNK